MLHRTLMFVTLTFLCAGYALPASAGPVKRIINKSSFRIDVRNQGHTVSIERGRATDEEGQVFAVKLEGVAKPIRVHVTPDEPARKAGRRLAQKGSNFTGYQTEFDPDADNIDVHFKRARYLPE